LFFFFFRFRFGTLNPFRKRPSIGFKMSNEFAFDVARNGERIHTRLIITPIEPFRAPGLSRVYQINSAGPVLASGLCARREFTIGTLIDCPPISLVQKTTTDAGLKFSLCFVTAGRSFIRVGRRFVRAFDPRKRECPHGKTVRPVSKEKDIMQDVEGLRLFDMEI
jgi:hypothetical protein